MKIVLTVGEDCKQSFLKEEGSVFLFPGQDFKPVNDLFENRKCDGYYVGPVIDDDLECNAECPAEGSEVIILIKDQATDLPIAGAVMDLRLDGVGVLLSTSNASGIIQFNVPYGKYTYTLTGGFNDPKVGDLVVDGCVDTTIIMSGLAPFNIHKFLSVLGPPFPGIYPLSTFFGPQIVPPGNAYRTKWRLRTDACGYDIIYFVGDLNDNGELLPTGTVFAPAPTVSGFDPPTKNFFSHYDYPEGIYLQLGVLINGVWTWLAASPCVSGGSTFEDFDGDGYLNEADASPYDPTIH